MYRPFTILCQFGGADLSLDKKVVTWTQHISVDNLGRAGVIGTGKSGVLVRSTSCLFVLQQRKSEL